MTQATEVGRWIARQFVSGHWEIAENESGERVARVAGPSGANARLIAAAPEMLEALRDAALDLTDYTDEPRIAEIVTAMRAAIAKATGQ
jgi:hypothetical protein